MPKRPFLDRRAHPETAKSQVFYAATTFFEGFMVSFLTLFINELGKALKVGTLFLSFALFLPPLFYALSALLFSRFVTTQSTNLKIMRWLLGGAFLSLCLLVLLGFLLPNGIGEAGEILSKGEAISYGATLLLLSALFMGFYGAFAAFHTNNVADINYAEGTRFGQSCLYASLSPILASPLAGLLIRYAPIAFEPEAYLFLFAFALFLLPVLFGLTYLFIPFAPEVFHDEGHEKVSSKELFGKPSYRLYLLLAALWIPALLASDSLTSSLWSAYENLSYTNAFNPVSWGFYIAVNALAEFIFVFLNTHYGFGRKIRFSMHLAFAIILLCSLSLGTLAYLFPNAKEGRDLPFALALIFLHAGRGMANGLYITSNITFLTHILGPKRRRKAVFLASFVFQAVNGALQFAYPFLHEARYIGFFLLAGVALLGFGLSFLLDVHIVHKRKAPAR